MLNKAKNKTAFSIALSGIIAALYVILTMAFYPISFGVVQVRISEMMTILPLFCPEAILGLSIGCLISNLFGNGVLDIVFGTFATFLASVCTYFVGKKIKDDIVRFAVGGLFPITLNALIVPFIFLMVTELKESYIISAFQVFIGQFLAVYVLGGVVYFVFGKRIEKTGIFKK